MGYQANDDRLSDLPLSIIDEILCRVPIRDIIRTCVLSRQWRYIWTSVPHLLFRCPAGRPNALDYRLMMESRKCPINFITNVLIHHKGPIHKFELCYPMHEFNAEHIDEWVKCLSRKGIRELSIRIEPSGWEVNAKLLKSSIYSCAKLRSLELRNFKMDPPPSTFKGFLFLTSLVLCGVDLSPCGVETLVGNCPLLERLRMVYSSSSELRIRSPNLKSLELVGDFVKLSLNAPLLVDMNVGLTDSPFTHEIQCSSCNYTNFFGECPNLMELWGFGYFTQYLSIGIAFYRPTIMFHHLKAVYLHGADFGRTLEIAVVAHLIIIAPNLQKLIITARTTSSVGGPDVSVKDFGCAPDFTLMKLTDVYFSYDCKYPSGIQLVKFLLETSPMLETMKLRISHCYSTDDMSTEILGFRRASPNAKITFS